MMKFILLVIGIIIVLSLLNVDIKGIVEHPKVRSNFEYATSAGKSVWGKYLSKPADYFWQNIFIDLIWDSFVRGMKRVKAGEPPIDASHLLVG